MKLTMRKMLFGLLALGIILFGCVQARTAQPAGPASTPLPTSTQTAAPTAAVTPRPTLTAAPSVTPSPTPTPISLPVQFGTPLPDLALAPITAGRLDRLTVVLERPVVNRLIASWDGRVTLSVGIYLDIERTDEPALRLDSVIGEPILTQPDGRFVLVVGAHQLQVFDTRTGALTYERELELIETGAPLRADELAALSSDGRYLALSLPGSEVVEVIDLQSGEVAAELPGSDPQWAGHGPLFSPQGRWLVIERGGAGILYDTSDWSQAGAFAYRPYNVRRWAWAFSPDETRFVQAVGQQMIVWSVADLKRVDWFSEVPDICSLVFSADSRYLAVIDTGCNGPTPDNLETVQVFDTSTGRAAALPVQQELTSAAVSVVDGELLVVPADEAADQTLLLGGQYEFPLDNDTVWLMGLADQLCQYTISNGSLNCDAYPAVVGHDSTDGWIAGWSQDNSRVLFSKSGYCGVYDRKTDAEQYITPVWCSGVFSPDAKYLAVEYTGLEVYNAETGQRVYQSGSEYSLHRDTFMLINDNLISTQVDNNGTLLLVWRSLTTGETRKVPLAVADYDFISPPPKSGWFLRSLAISPSGSLAAMVTTSGELLIVDAQSGELLYGEQLMASAFWVRFSPDEKLLAVFGSGGLKVLAVPGIAFQK